MNKRGVRVGEILVATGSYTVSMNNTHKHNITKSKMYKITQLYDTSFSIIDNFNDEIGFSYDALNENSIFHMFCRLNVERVKKIKSLEL